MFGLTGCSTVKTAKPIDPEINVIAAAANKAFAHGQVEQAARQYTRALERARAADATTDIADQAYNLAACLLILDQPAQARTLLREAQAEAQRVERRAVDILLLEAKAARLAGQREEVLRQVAALLAIKPVIEPAERLQALLVKAMTFCDAEQVPSADQTEIRRLALEVSDPAIQAEVAHFLGTCDLIEKEFARAAAAFDREAALRQNSGRFREMAQALARAGAAYAHSEQQALAADRLTRAARSLFAQGDSIGALHQIEPALIAAKASKQDELVTHVIALFEEIKKTIPSTPR
ncbi:MAG: hypothetical protein EPN23_06800 [Verrucomicrobia bacterium]|nr:MAG: hypothetical protein EPN23_06800 [Verrucomicrobiota bacterium]